MAKRPGEKNKLYLLAEYLYRNTDEKHTVTVDSDDGGTMKSMQAYLESVLGYRPDRKSIYRDLALIGKGIDGSGYDAEGFPTMGLDLKTAGRGNWYVDSRGLTLEEVKLLSDVVRSSNFITAKKTEQLVKKLTGFVSVHQRAALNREVYVRNRVKARNENVFENIDVISDAINSNRRILFRYAQYTVRNGKLAKEYRHGGRMYEASPFTLIWVDQNYYMLAYDGRSAKVRTYRVDRMHAVARSENRREGIAEFEKTDMSIFTTKVFHMFRATDPVPVTMRFSKAILDSVVDRFGEDIIIIPDTQPDRFSFTTDIVVSPQFYGWLAGFGTEMEIKGPPSVRKGFSEFITGIRELYDGEKAGKEF